MKQWPFLFTRLLLVSMAAGTLIVADNATTLAAEPSLSITVSPSTTVAYNEGVTLTAEVSDPAQVASYRWAHVGGSQDLSIYQQVTDRGTKVTIGAAGRWPHSPGTRTFQAIVTLNDRSQVTATQAISFINPPPVSELARLPDPVPAFTPNPDADHTPGRPVSHSYTGDHVQTLDPGVWTETHVSFDNGTLTPPDGRRGVNISNAHPSDAHAITIGSNAEINVTKAFATSIITRNNKGDVRIVNRGTINLPETGRGLHAAMQNAPGNARLVNYGTIKLDGPTAEPEEVWTTKPHLLNAHMLRAGAPHDFVDYGHSAELINMPDASLIATGTYNGITSKWPAKMRNNGSMGGLKTEAGGGHLGRVINHGKIDIEATAGRGLWAYGLWGAAQAHNFGTVTMSGLSSQGIRVVNCAPYPFDENGCHQALNEIITDPDGTPGDVYARNYPTGVVTTLPSTREGDTRTHRKAYGILAYSKTAGRVFAINEGAISTAGKNSHGIYARGYGNARDQNVNYPHIPDYPDTSDHDAIYAANTGAITTDGTAAHGIDAEHARGGQITVLNLKTTTTTGKQSRGTITTEGKNSAGIFVHAPAGAVPVSTCNTADSNSPDASCERVVVVSSVEIVNTGDITADGSGGSGIEVSSDGGEVDVDNSGDIIADGSDGIGIGVINDGGEVNVDNSGDIIADDIGIDVISDGGDITIVHTGDITASQVGIRVQTSGQGRIRLEIEGELNAPTPYEVIGGVNNEIIEDTD